MKKLIFIMSIFTIVVLAGCVPEESIDTTVENGGAYERDVNANKENSVEMTEEKKEEIDKSTENESTDDEKINEKLKLISKYEYKAETVDFDNDLNGVIQKAHDLGGYVRSSNVRVDNQSMNSKKSANVVLRVPSEKVTEMIQFLRSTVSIESEVVNSVDITDEYYDMKEKLDNLVIRENRLIELYQRTTEISEIIEIDEKLFEIEELKEEELRKKSKVDDRIVFSRLEVDLEEVSKLSSEPATKGTPKEKLLNALSSLGENVKSFFVGTSVVLIKYFPLLLIVTVGLYVYKRFVYNKGEKEKHINTEENDEEE